MKWKARLDNIHKALQFLGEKFSDYETVKSDSTISLNVHNEHIHLDDILKNYLNNKIQILIPAGFKASLYAESAQWDSLTIKVEFDAQLNFMYCTKKNEKKQINTISFALEKNARVDCFIAFLHQHAELVCVEAELLGSDSNFDLRAIAYGNTQRNALITHQRHKTNSARSTVKVKSIVSEESRFWFHGTIFIDKNASETSAEQESHILLMNSRAQAHAIPALEVLNKDVSCRHGSAMATIDEEQRFYLMSRGLSSNEAEKIIIDGFLFDIINSYRYPEALYAILKK